MTNAARKLVIIADDFGLTKAVTEGILQCLDQGIVTDVALMPNGEYYEQAAQQLLRRGRKHVGIHFTVVDHEKPLAPSERVQKLIKADGYFGDRNLLMRRAFFDRGVREQLALEFREQIYRVLKSGLSICHISSHQHVHLFPTISTIVISLAKEFQIPFIRLPRIKSCTPIGMAVNIFSWLMWQHLKKTDLQAFHFICMEFSGHLSLKILYAMLSRIKVPVAELMVHPGFNDDYSLHKYEHWNFDWEKELDTLRSPELESFLKEKNIRRVSFKELL